MLSQCKKLNYNKIAISLKMKNRLIFIGDFEIGKRAGIAVPVVSIDQAVMAKKGGSDLIEVRIDLLECKNTKKIVDFVCNIKKHLKLPIIATNRAKNEGGSFKGTEQERISILTSVLEFSDAVDIELSTVDKNLVIDEAKRLGNTVIVSHHNFNKTPIKEEMLKMIEMMYDSGGDIAKLAVMPKTQKDVFLLLEVGMEICTPLILISMGKLGRYTRFTPSFYGSSITYGFVEGEVAPGQFSVKDLKNIFDITGQ